MPELHLWHAEHVCGFQDRHMVDIATTDLGSDSSNQPISDKPKQFVLSPVADDSTVCAVTCVA